eukprot:CAMPEP_0183401776 /NCGR_PEP_ID=MMETSP0370-20130417/13469_1 /TAXON_ID=268820 /ORGANISM="Peridinium aciculiferum, Strain PAER-2" /LENGTH=546 /DNA_ID=CAMNT_0025583265 /DNA_START=53 /DNA_END=1693 /DNA_ORIENTATION=+
MTSLGRASAQRRGQGDDDDDEEQVGLTSSKVSHKFPQENNWCQRIPWVVLMAYGGMFAMGALFGQRGLSPPKPVDVRIACPQPTCQCPQCPTPVCPTPVCSSALPAELSAPRLKDTGIDIHAMFGPAPQCSVGAASLEERGLIHFLESPKVEIFCASDYVNALQRLLTEHLTTIDALLRRKDVDVIQFLLRAQTGVHLSSPLEENQPLARLQDHFKRVFDPLQLMQYEWLHPTYRRYSFDDDAYTQLYQLRRIDSQRHLPCPSAPHLYSMYEKLINFPSCPIKRFNDVPRVVDGYITGNGIVESGQRGDWWTDPSFDTRVIKGEIDPTLRLRHGVFQFWAGVPVAKFPTDLWCYEMIMWDRRPEVIIELGTSRGGATVWFAAHCKMFELPCVVHTVDLPLGQWRSNDDAMRAARAMKVDDRIVWHFVDGGSTNDGFRAEMKELCQRKSCMVVSDSNHVYEHTHPEMTWFSQVVTPGQYLVVEDTNIYAWNGWVHIFDKDEQNLKKGPFEAANDFAASHPGFTRTDWCTNMFALTQQPFGWFYRNDW